MGIVFIYLTSQLTESNTQNIIITRTSATIYYSASLSLNVLVTFMIIARLILHRKNVLNAMGTRAGIGRWCKAVITVLVESSALHTTSFLLFIGPWRAGSPARFLFYQILVESQVRAVLTFPDTTPFGSCRLIVVTNRLLLRSLLPSGWPTGRH